MSIKLKRILRGLAKSWSANFSMIAVALGGLEQYSGTLTKLIGADNAGIVLMMAGVIGLVLRFKTTQSLEEKGIKK